MFFLLDDDRLLQRTSIYQAEITSDGDTLVLADPYRTYSITFCNEKEAREELEVLKVLLQKLLSDPVYMTRIRHRVIRARFTSPIMRGGIHGGSQKW